MDSSSTNPTRISNRSEVDASSAVEGSITYLQLGAYNRWACVLSVLVLLVVPGVAQGQTVPGGSASKPGGAPSGGGGSDDNQECVYYGIPPEFDIRQGRGIFFELWFGGSHVYDYDYVNKVAYPTSPYSFFGPNGPVGVADLSALLAQARKPRPKPYTGPTMRGPLDASTAAFFERVAERQAKVEFAVNTVYEVAVTIQEVATKRPRPRPRPRPLSTPRYLFRGDRRSSSEVYRANGFSARGKDLSIPNHYQNKSKGASAYVALTSSLDFAKRRALNGGTVFTIETKDLIVQNVVHYLRTHHPRMYRRHQGGPIDDEFEWVVARHIPLANIVGGRKMQDLKLEDFANMPPGEILVFERNSFFAINHERNH